MWTVLGPLLLFVVVILFQLGKTKETFATSTDASGNVVDASGSPVGSSSLIQLTLSDLLKLFKAATPAPPPTPPQPKITIKDAIQEVVVQKPTTSKQIRPSILQEIKSQLVGAPFEPAAPIPRPCTMESDSVAQGMELVNAKVDLVNNADYIRKDSIPCYGCSP